MNYEAILNELQALTSEGMVYCENNSIDYAVAVQQHDDIAIMIEATINYNYQITLVAGQEWAQFTDAVAAAHALHYATHDYVYDMQDVQF